MHIFDKFCIDDEDFFASRIKRLEKLGCHLDEKVTVSAHKYNVIQQRLRQYDVISSLNWRDVLP